MRVMISELKAKLSAYLDAVRSGKTVIVLDRKTPIARLVPFSPRASWASADGFHIADASRPIAELGKIEGVRLNRRIDVDKILAESRGKT